jgi:hydroxyacylglutathione hydrolase
MERPGEIMARMPGHWLSSAVGPLWAGPPHPVSRRLREADSVGSFRVIETPGHTAGHVSFWRESDRVLIIGDVLSHLNIYTGWVTLREPERFFTLDPAENRRSARRLIELEPKLICFGHGPPLRDAGRFVNYVQRLPGP